MPRKWSNLAFNKFCAFPEFIPFQMNLPSEDTVVNKAGGISFESFAGSGPAGPLGEVFVNPHFVQGKSEAFDFSYNSTDLKYNFQGKLELKKSKFMEKLNIEHEVSGRPVGILLATDIPLKEPTALDALEVGARTAEGKLQVGFRSKITKDIKLQDPKVEFGYQVTDTVKAGVQFGLKPGNLASSDIDFRFAAKESGFIGTGHIATKDRKFSSALFTVQAPKLDLAGYPVTVTTQVKTEGGAPTEAKAVAEVKVCPGYNLKLKASRTKDGDQFTASAIFNKLPGDFDLTIGATSSQSGIKYGALLAHGYYSFVGW